jgi:hypothetical protein
MANSIPAVDVFAISELNLALEYCADISRPDE